MAHVRFVMEQANIRISNLSLKNLNVPSSSVEELLDLEHLENESREWGAAHYLKWREESPFSVCLYDGKIPYILRFMGQVVKILRKGNAVVDGKIAYVNSHSPNIEETLFEVSSRNGLSELMLLQLLRYKNENEDAKTSHPVIERVVETVVLPEKVEEHEEIIENPNLEAIQELKSKSDEGQLKLSFDLSDISEDMLEALMKIAKSSRIIVPKDALKKDAEE